MRGSWPRFNEAAINRSRKGKLEEEAEAFDAELQ